LDKAQEKKKLQYYINILSHTSSEYVFKKEIMEFFRRSFQISYIKRTLAKVAISHQSAHLFPSRHVCLKVTCTVSEITYTPAQDRSVSIQLTTPCYHIN
jgi:hypothetical protein